MGNKASNNTDVDHCNPGISKDGFFCGSTFDFDSDSLWWNTAGDRDRNRTGSTGEHDRERDEPDVIEFDLDRLLSSIGYRTGDRDIDRRAMSSIKNQCKSSD